ncbi:hypothetical protein FRC08_005454 [Ceratobasidium sp. 394]|nr:hypothetical protein FRC08_005454 [Ceratobasidium sp. 394]
MECFDLVLETLVESKGAFTLATSVAPELFYDSSIEWRKVMAHLVQPVEMGIVDFKDKHSDATRDMFRMLNVWAQYAGSLQGVVGAEMCVHPCCIQLKAHYTCGRCNAAAYCSMNCQRAHWELPTSESHRMTCNPPTDLVQTEGGKF